MKNGPYEMLIAPKEYPGKRYRGRYAYEHHIVWWKKTKEIIKRNEVIHHKNHNKIDNRISNLELICRSEHTSNHARPKILLKKNCGFCHKEIFREKRQTYGRKAFFCCKKHQYLSMTKLFRDSSVSRIAPC